jgi:predicted nucleic acid-binding protein
MIFADASAWIDHFRGVPSPVTAKLRELLATVAIHVGDLILMEVLRGTRNDTEAAALRSAMLLCEYHEMVPPGLAVAAARSYRQLRELGYTIRSPIDCLVATFCIATGTELLHNDRDFDPFERHLGLRTVAVA